MIDVICDRCKYPIGYRKTYIPVAGRAYHPRCWERWADHGEEPNCPVPAVIPSEAARREAEERQRKLYAKASYHRRTCLKLAWNLGANHYALAEASNYHKAGLLTPPDNPQWYSTKRGEIVCPW